MIAEDFCYVEMVVARQPRIMIMNQARHKDGYKGHPRTIKQYIYGKLGEKNVIK